MTGPAPSTPPVVVIPAYQAAATLAAVVAGVRSALPDAIVVAVDDGSTDDTRAVARASCDETIGFDRNRGKGAALRAGFGRALESVAQVVLTIDADGQHEPARAPALVAALVDADVAVGARTRGPGSSMPLGRRATNALSARAMSVCAGQRIVDAQSGFRAIRRQVLECVRPRGDRYEFETEFLLEAARAGHRIVSVPVPTVYGSASHFRPLSDGWRVVRAIWNHRPGVDAPVRAARAF